MNRTLTTLLLLSASLSCAAVVTGAPAGKVMCRDGYVKFFSKTPMEDILAETHTTVAIFEPSTAHLRVRMMISSFVFPNHLMQEHFNENYMETDKFPMSIFEGTAQGLDWTKLKAGEANPVTVSGDLEIHGVKKHYDVPGTFKLAADGTYSGDAVFKVRIADHGIKVPSIVTKNIAEEVEITLHLQGKIEVTK